MRIINVILGTVLIVLIFTVGENALFLNKYTTKQEETDLAGRTFTEDKRRPFMQSQSQERQEFHLPTRPLEFVHITKTGGTSIEAAAALVGVNWGVCHYEKIEDAGCILPPDLDYTETTKFVGKESWHQPLQHFVDNPFRNADTFAVVRNPYDRYISEYYCPWGGSNAPNINKDDPDVMNDYLQKRIPKEIEPHWLPQHYYIFDKGKRMVDHVLHFEKLEMEFPELMKQYNLHIVLPNKKHNSFKNSNKLTAEDLYPETLAIINHVAALDFELFGYPKVIDMHV